VTRRLCVDVDNCVAATDEVMRQIIHQVTDGRVNFAYDDIVEFDYHGPSCRDKSGERIDEATWHKVHEQFSEPDIVMSLKPMPGAADMLRALQLDFDIHFVTTRKPKARAATIHWLDCLGLDSKRPPALHFVGHRQKHDVIRNLSAAIDDDPVQAESFAQMGIKSILLDHPWNRNANSEVLRARDWSEVAELLKQ